VCVVRVCVYIYALSAARYQQLRSLLKVDIKKDCRIRSAFYYVQNRDSHLIEYKTSQERKLIDIDSIIAIVIHSLHV